MALLSQRKKFQVTGFRGAKKVEKKFLTRRDARAFECKIKIREKSEEEFYDPYPMNEKDILPLKNFYVCYIAFSKKQCSIYVINNDGTKESPLILDIKEKYKNQEIYYSIYACLYQHRKLDKSIGLMIYVKGETDEISDSFNSSREYSPLIKSIYEFMERREVRIYNVSEDNFDTYIEKAERLL